MKREFAFEDSLRMLEVLWSSLPTYPPEKELKLYDIQFQPITATPPISPLVKTPRENAYTKVCALRRQSSSISLSNYTTKKSGTVKRQNHSLDETISKSRNNIVDIKMKHQSLDDAALSRQKLSKSIETSPKTAEVSPRSPKNELRPRSVSPLEAKSDSYILCNGVNAKRNSLSSSMTNLIKTTKKSGHFKDLKERIAAAKLFSSLERLDNSIKEEKETKPRGKMVKNLNEFLNFAAVNKNKISDKLIRMGGSDVDVDKPKILLTKSSFDDSESSSLRHYSSTSNEDTFDEYSPDDSQEYFPLTTSVTRELRLELENLDRKVFGNKYIERLSESPSSEGSSEVKTERVEEVPKTKCQDRKSDDIFVWENPLLSKTSPTSMQTPDEQADLEYDNEAPTLVNETSATKTVTPIKVITVKPTKVVKIEEELPRVSLPVNGAPMTNSCEEVTEVVRPTLLPPPGEFGGGNPFLMFLCITVLLQHRDHIISKGMDYNEMAMHFDKMVRKHDVTRVLNQARQMHARYIKQHTIAQQKQDC